MGYYQSYLQTMMINKISNSDWCVFFLRQFQLYKKIHRSERLHKCRTEEKQINKFIGKYICYFFMEDKWESYYSVTFIGTLRKYFAEENEIFICKIVKKDS